MFVAVIRGQTNSKVVLYKYFRDAPRSTVGQIFLLFNGALALGFFNVFVPIIGMHLVHKYGWEHWLFDRSHK